jgi:hypothetical protein
MENFIDSVVVFINRFLSNKGVVIIMHAYDPQVLKDIRSFLQSYQLKVHMKWIIMNSSPQMSSDPSFKYHGSHFIHMFVHFTFFERQDSLKFYFFLVDSCKPCHPSCEGSNSKHRVFLEISVIRPFY